MLSRVRELMHEYPRAWWVAGGWAIDLHLGHQSRAHQDIDIAVLRRDQDVLRRHLPDWRFTKVVSSVRFAWHDREYLELPTHEIYAENGVERLEFLFNEAEDDRWLFRRNAAVSMSLGRMTRHSRTGIPYLCPEVVLLYKAKSLRADDRADFRNVLPRLEPDAKAWLAQALECCHPQHEWLGDI